MQGAWPPAPLPHQILVCTSNPGPPLSSVVVRNCQWFCARRSLQPSLAQDPLPHPVRRSLASPVLLHDLFSTSPNSLQSQRFSSTFSPLQPHQFGCCYFSPASSSSPPRLVQVCSRALVWSNGVCKSAFLSPCSVLFIVEYFQ